MERKKLPEGWEWKKIEEIVDSNSKYPIGDGDHGQIKPFMYTKEGIPYIRVNDIRNNTINMKEIVYISLETHKNNLKGELFPGDIVIAKTGATIGRTAIIPLNIERANTTSSVGKITVDNDKILPKYLLFYLNTKSFKEEMWRLSHKSAQPGFNIIDLKNFLVPVPPLQIQRKIVEIIEKGEKIKQRKQNTKDETNEVLKSIFYNMFGNNSNNEKKWDVKKIKEIGEVVSGSTPKTNNPIYWEGEINWVTPAELIDGDNYYYFKTQRRITKEGLKSIGGKLLPKDTVLLTTRAPIGKVAIAGEVICSNQGFKNIICKREIINPIYLYCWLLINKSYLNSIGTGSTFMEINKKTVEDISIIVPPITLQNKFAEIIEKFEKIKKHQENSMNEVNNLFDTLIQKSFNGEIVK